MRRLIISGLVALAVLAPLSANAGTRAAGPQRLDLDSGAAGASVNVTRERGGFRLKGEVRKGRSSGCSVLEAVTTRMGSTTLGGGSEIARVCEEGGHRQFNRWTKRPGIRVYTTGASLDWTPVVPLTGKEADSASV
ncbi:hypothetical protein ACIO3O_41845 [Streptomyces sp. NPDC087440]|uniref:hypothetical protein n=1 Tax=Streptomyces sp. NPDC087440 TaxID=3365790 RepID=UPI0037FA7108